MDHEWRWNFIEKKDWLHLLLVYEFTESKCELTESKHRLFEVISSYHHMCQGLNSHYFHTIGDGHQPNSRGLYTHYQDSLLKGGRFPIPNKNATTLTMAHIPKNLAKWQLLWWLVTPSLLLGWKIIHHSQLPRSHLSRVFPSNLAPYLFPCQWQNHP